jgi:hypothetical protein
MNWKGFSLACSSEVPYCLTVSTQVLSSPSCGDGGRDSQPEAMQYGPRPLPQSGDDSMHRTRWSSASFLGRARTLGVDVCGNRQLSEYPLAMTSLSEGFRGSGVVRHRVERWLERLTCVSGGAGHQLCSRGHALLGVAVQASGVLYWPSNSLYSVSQGSSRTPQISHTGRPAGLTAEGDGHLLVELGDVPHGLVHAAREEG